MISIQKILLCLARIIASLAILFFFLFIIGEGISELIIKGMKLKIEGALLFLFLVFAALATFIAWRREKLGAHLLLASGLCLAIFSFVIADRNKLLMALVMGGPFVLSALLIYLTLIKKRSREVLKIDSQYEKQETLSLD